MSQGIIFNIQKYSLHDGPGIRTTVFLKGCPLSCWWCHNPESQRKSGEFIFLRKKCILCRDCERVCLKAAVKFTENGLCHDREKCILCGECFKACPSEAIEILGEKTDVDEIVKEVEKDRIFYDESGGGVTLSGGEPLMQIDFVDGILTALKERGIHTVVDTSGYTSWENFKRIQEKVDLFLYDIKHMDDEEHTKYTGISNKLILDNLKKLALNGNKIWIRVPIIPSINDDDLNIQRVCNYILSLNLREIFILPYHNIAIDKYRRVDMEYKMPDIQEPSDKKMEEIAEKFKECGLIVKIGG